MAEAAVRFGWRHDEMMAMRPRLVRAYLSAWHRVSARERLMDAMTFGYTGLTEASKRTLRNLWAQISRGEEPDPDEASGRQVVGKEAIRDWLKRLPPVSTGGQTGGR